MSTPVIGDVLTTTEQLDACPEGTIVRTTNGFVYVREVNLWSAAGGTFRRASMALACAPWPVVVWVPPVTDVEFYTDVITSVHGDGHGAIQQDEWTTRLLAPFVDCRVRVTVEKIGADQ